MKEEDVKPPPGILKIPSGSNCITREYASPSSPNLKFRECSSNRSCGILLSSSNNKSCPRYVAVKEQDCSNHSVSDCGYCVSSSDANFGEDHSAENSLHSQPKPLTDSKGEVNNYDYSRCSTSIAGMEERKIKSSSCPTSSCPFKGEYFLTSTSLGNTSHESSTSDLKFSSKVTQLFIQ